MTQPPQREFSDEEIAAIEAELESEFPDRVAAAQRALGHRIQETA